MCAAVIPATFGDITTPAWTAALIGGVLLAYGINYITMRYWWAALTILIQSGLWMVVLARVL